MNYPNHLVVLRIRGSVGQLNNATPEWTYRTNQNNWDFLYVKNVLEIINFSKQLKAVKPELHVEYLSLAFGILHLF
jgi:hypothetical protein